MSRADSILHPLLADLHGGSLGAGARLPPERELAQRFGASRACVREALAQLEAWRVIQTLHGSGARVAPRERWSLGALAAALASAPPPLSGRLREAATGALALRRGLLRQALPAVCLRAHELGGQLETLLDAVEDAWRARQDAAAFVEADARAVQLTFAAAGAWPSAWLAADLCEVATALARRLPGPLAVDPGYRDGRRHLLEALCGADEAAAARLLAGHLAGLDRALLEAP